MFGGNGGIAPVPGATGFGLSHTGQQVNSSAAYVAAQATLRTSTGHDASKASTFVNPPNFAAYDAGLSTPDTTKPSGQSVATQVAALQAMGIEPVVVDWNTVRCHGLPRAPRLAGSSKESFERPSHGGFRRAFVGRVGPAVPAPRRAGH